MDALLITNARIVSPGHGITCGDLLIADGRIADRATPGAVSSVTPRLDAAGRLLTPGLIDVHTHGIHEFVYEDGPEPCTAAAARLGAYGCTTVFPTLVPKLGKDLLPRIARLAQCLDGITQACVPGLHLEGPFTALAGAGCATLPGDLGLLEELLAAAHGRLAIMSLSPETHGILPVIERLVAAGVVPFLTHTRAGVDATQAAIDAGARHATHFYDVFHVPAETEPGARPVGAVEVILGDPRATVDFICDGVHVHPAAIRAALAAKGWTGVLLITDSNLGAGLPDGEYATPYGYGIEIGPRGGARLAGNVANRGALAGSALTMNVGMRNLLRWLRLPPEQVWAMGTANPARLLRLSGKGVIRPGADADLVLWNEDLTPARTWVGGRCVFDAS